MTFRDKQVAFYIDFKRGAGSASRFFEATHQFTKACERFDQALTASIDTNIKTVMVLEDIVTLSEGIQKLAEETRVRHLADYPQVNPASLIKAITDFDEVKDHLVEGDEAAMIVPDGEPAEFDITFRVDIQAIQEFAIREVQKHNVPSMVLVVRKPDYLGSSMWDFRHGSRALSARIEDASWLLGFQARKIEVRPGMRFDARRGSRWRTVTTMS